MRNCDTVGYESKKAVEELVEIYEDSDEGKNKENIEEDKENPQEKIDVDVLEEIGEKGIPATKNRYATNEKNKRNQ